MIKLSGESTNPGFDPERVRLNIHPSVRERLRALLMRREMRAVGYSEFIDRACALAEEELAPPCEAVFYHGPGHQSGSKCEVRGEHEIHQVKYRCGTARWTGDEGMSGFFDEPPEDPEEQ